MAILRLGNSVRIVPCLGREKVLDILDVVLALRAKRNLVRVVLNVDADANADGTPFLGTKLVTRESVENKLRNAQILFQEGQERCLTVENGTTEICLVRWEASDAPCPELPHQQTLERMVCAAIIAAYPERGTHVLNWLNSRQRLLAGLCPRRKVSLCPR
jgi:hypothetical protein